jgi:hypothetical protein
VGGDVARGLGLAGRGVPRATAAASVLADRVVGLFALALVALAGGVIGLLFRPHQGPWLSATLFALLLVGILALLCRPAGIALLGKAPWLSAEGGLARKARRLLSAIALLAEREGAMRKALVLSLGLSAFSTIYHWAIGRAIGITVPLVAYCVIVPAVMLFSSLPITLNGLGIREVGFVELLIAQGVARSEATVFALLAFLGTIGFAIAGGALFLWGEREKWTVRPEEIR